MNFGPFESKYHYFRLLVSFFCALCGLSVSISAQEWKTVNDGVEYAQVTKEIGGLNVSMNLLRLDLTKVRLDVVHAFDKAIGVDTTSNIAKAHRAFAAINAGFFRLDKSEFLGDPAGIELINGRIYSEAANNRIALVIDSHRRNTAVMIHQLQTILELRVGRQYFKDAISLTGINRERKSDDVILYAPEFGASTRSGPKGNEVIVSKCVRAQEHRGFWFDSCTVKEIGRNSGDNRIPRDGFVISFSPEATKAWSAFETDVARFAATRPTKIFIDYEFGLDSDNLLYPQPTTDIVGGVPQLIKNGKIDISWEQEKTTRSFVETRHPRTAVAKLKDGKFLMITVDGRSESSGGIGLQDLAEYLLSLGATDAMNLDGGGSTTMFLDGKVVNHPSDKEGERKVSDAILVTLRKPTRK